MLSQHPSDAFRSTFSHRHVVLPVILVETLSQTLRNARIAQEAGADGVFLINHDISSASLLEIHQKAAEAFPGWWLGVNCLDLRPELAFSQISAAVSGLWADNAGIDEDRADQPRAERIQEAQKRSGWKGLYFGGVAFKYQRPVHDLRSATISAARFMDVVTTSGPGTGAAASLEKIRAMKQALGAIPLAIASGITPANIGDYLPLADCFLVATGISRSFEELDPILTKTLIERVRAFSG